MSSVKSSIDRTHNRVLASPLRGSAPTPIGHVLPGTINKVSAETQSTDCLVIGGSGLVGGYIVDRLVKDGQRPFALSRSPRSSQLIDWYCGDLHLPDTLRFPPFATLYCTADAVVLAEALPRLIHPELRRVVAFSSTSVITKQDTEVASERAMIRRLAVAEQ